MYWHCPTINDFQKSNTAIMGILKFRIKIDKIPRFINNYFKRFLRNALMEKKIKLQIYSTYIFCTGIT